MSPQEEHELVEHFAQVVEKKLDERRSISEEQHRADHEFVRMLRDRERRRLDRREKVITHIYGWGIVLLITTLIGAIGAWLRDWVNGD